MRRLPQWRAVALLAAVAVLLVCASCAAAAPTRESQVHCTPTETEPYSPITCVVQVRDGYQEPTMNFEPTDFLVTTHASSAAAVVTKSAVTRGKDVTTAVFTVTVSTGADVLIRVYVREATATGTGFVVAEVQGSGITVSVLSWPASRLGTITCTAQSTGLHLRAATTCRVAVYDEASAPSVVHSSDVVFSETNYLGSFAFISGTRELVFRFTAPPTTPVIVSTFTLKLRLRGADPDTDSAATQTVQFPLLYPTQQALATATGLRCAAETRPITCSITAADTQGPVAFNASHFRLYMERLGDTGGDASAVSASTATWMDITNAFNWTIGPSPLRPYVGVVLWELKVNNAIHTARLRVTASRDGTALPDRGGSGDVADVAGSPYAFTTGAVPNGRSVTLRGCRESVVTAGNTTPCYIDLANGVSGDPDYFVVTTSQRKSSVSNFTYTAYDAVCRCRSLWFTYNAPNTLTARVDDYLNVSVYTDVERTAAGLAVANNVPLRLDVFPVASGAGHDTVAAATDAVLVAFGFVFYGSVLGTGAVLIVRRSRKSARIRHERALKERAVTQEMDRQRAAAALTALVDPTTGPSAAGASSTAVGGGTATKAAGGVGGDGVGSANAAMSVGPGAPGYDTINMLEAEAGRGPAPPTTPTAVVRNVAVPQERFHSDSD